ncbi:MAG: SGNH/GDSL hydrolase family protein [Gemmatales bacterium]
MHSLVILTLILANPTQVQANPPTRLLFVGNSYTYSNDLPVLVQTLYVAAKLPQPEIEQIMMGGAALGDHWRNPRTTQRLINGKWNYIVMQQGPSSLASSQKEFLADMEKAKPWLKQSGAKPAMFMVWPDTSRRKYFPQVRNAYADAARSVDGIFIPAGLAWQDLLSKHPSMELYSGDGLHPTPLGTYIAAIVIVSRLTGLPPERFPTSIRWSGQYQVTLSKDQVESVLDAVRLALKDAGK